LPIGPTHRDLSPYQALSAHAGNPYFIDLSELVENGLLEGRELAQPAADLRQQLLSIAAKRFFADDNDRPDGLDRSSYQHFRAINDYWLDDFCLFCAIREVQGLPGWLHWPEPLRARHTSALQ
jgi:4-alpha-glucanotransferase